MIFLLLVICLAAAHPFDATYQFTKFHENNGWIYLQTFHFSPHLAKMELILNVEGKALTSKSQNIIIQGIPNSEWDIEQQLKCSSVLKMPIVMQELKMDGRQTAGIFQFAVPKKESYSFVIKDCHQMLRAEYDNSKLSLRIRMKILTNQQEPAYNQKQEEIRIVPTQDQKKPQAEEL